MILLVRHGDGRGRNMVGKRRYMEHALEDLEQRRPTLWQRLRLHQTGDGPASLAGVRAILFWLADPLREFYPECFAEASAIEVEARARDIACLNPPSALSNSIKSRQAELWLDARIPSPRQRRFESREELLRLAGETALPAIVRDDERHVQKGMRICATRAEIEAIPVRELPQPGSLVPLVDVRESYRARGDDSLFSGYHHKMRALVVGERVLAHELFFAPSPIVSAMSCTFRRPGRGLLRRHRSARLEPEVERCVEADLAWWRAGQAQAETMLRACGALGFSFAAIDYAEGPNGAPVLWEANPYFYLPRPERMFLPRERRLPERHRELYDALGDWFEKLLS